MEDVRARVRPGIEAQTGPGRLIRLLGVMAEPGCVDAMLDRTLTALGETFAAAVVVLRRPAADEGYDHLGGHGLAPGLPLPHLPDPSPGGRHARAWTSPCAEAPRLTGRGLPAGAHVPLSPGHPEAGELVLLRDEPLAFSQPDLQLLQSVAERLRSTLEEGRRQEALEHLVLVGHRFTAQLELPELLDVTATVLRDMTRAEWASVLTVTDGILDAVARLGHVGSTLLPIPMAEFPLWEQVRDGSPAVLSLPPEEIRRDYGVGATTLLWVPVTDRGEVVALLVAGHSVPGHFGRSAPEAVTVLAGYVGAALLSARLTEELRVRATHDPLTGLANRDLVRQALDARLGPDQPVGLLFCDLDNFKSVNDRLGHEAGDDLLQKVARRLEAAIGPEDVLARLGGDEFLVVLPGAEQLDDVRAAGARVLAALEEPFRLRGEVVRVGASLGGVVSERGSGAVELLRDADAAMYRAKERGRGRVEVVDGATAQLAVERLRLRDELTHALDRDQLWLHHQPIVELATGRVVGFEALVRWTHPELGPVPPDVFVPIAEESGEITAIGAWVLATACRDLAGWKQQPGTEDLFVDVNVSARQLDDPRFPAQVLAAVRAAGVRTRDVCLEITESVEVTHKTLGRLRELRRAGIRLALDDFGTSYSNLRHLKQLPVESLKIDRGFVAGLAPAADHPVPHQGAERAPGIEDGIVRAIMAIAAAGNLSVIAEGVETRAQRDLLLALGCRYAQGYLFSRPVPVAVANTLLARGVLAAS